MIIIIVDDLRCLDKPKIVDYNLVLPYWCVSNHKGEILRWAFLQDGFSFPSLNWKFQDFFVKFFLGVQSKSQFLESCGFFFSKQRKLLSRIPSIGGANIVDILDLLWHFLENIFPWRIQFIVRFFFYHNIIVEVWLYHDEPVPLVTIALTSHPTNVLWYGFTHNNMWNLMKIYLI